MPLTDVTGRRGHCMRPVAPGSRSSRSPTPDPDLGMADGYAVQQQLTSMLLADGDRIVGYKVGSRPSHAEDDRC